MKRCLLAIQWGMKQEGKHDGILAMCGVKQMCHGCEALETGLCTGLMELEE